MFEMNMETSINNMNYLRYMDEEEKKAADDNGRQNIVWGESCSPQSQNQDENA